MATAIQVEIRGLRSLLAALKLADPAADREMQGVLNEAGNLIIQTAIPMMESQFVSDPSRLSGDLVKSLRSQATRTSGKVVEGYPVKVPYAGWWEFGGPRDGGGRPPKRLFKKEGRGLYPAYQKIKPEIDTMILAGLTRVADIIVTFNKGRD